jgi:hypothetical protein
MSISKSATALKQAASAELIFSLLYFLVLITKLTIVSQSPNRTLVQLVPDDAFYYLKLAKNFALTGLWTFDGKNPATGFQPLFAYFLTLVYKVIPGIEFKQIFILVGLISTLFLFASIYMISRLTKSVFGRRYTIAVYLIFLGKFVMLNQMSMMESWLSIFFTSSAFYLIYKRSTESEPNYFYVLAFFIGFFGVLSRVDFILLSLALFLSSYLQSSQKNLKSVLTLKAFILLISSLFGLVIVALQNWAISGKFSQGSTEVKLFWTHQTGVNFRQPINMFSEIIFPNWANISRSPKVALVLALVVLASRYVLKKQNLKTEKFWVGFSSLLSTFLFVGLYSLNSQGFQVWYSANLIVIGIFSLVVLLDLITRFKKIILISYCATILIPSSFNAIGSTRYYINQSTLYDAAVNLGNSDTSLRVGSWNAGILGYFSNKPIINLDGLVNDNAVKYIKQGKLSDYIILNKILFIADYKSMFTSSVLKLRGGYDIQNFETCFLPVKALSSSWNHDWDTILYNVDLNCLKDLSTRKREN